MKGKENKHTGVLGPRECVYVHGVEGGRQAVEFMKVSS